MQLIQERGWHSFWQKHKGYQFVLHLKGQMSKTLAVNWWIQNWLVNLVCCLSVFPRSSAFSWLVVFEIYHAMCILQLGLLLHAL